VTASGQVVARVSTLILTVAGTAVVTRTIGEGGFANWGTVLMVTAMFAFLLDPGFAPVVVRRLARGGEEAPSPEALLKVRLLLSAIAFVVVVALVLALRGSAAFVLAVVLGAQLFPRAVVMNVGTWLQAEHRLHVQTWFEALTVGGGLAVLLLAAALDASPPVLAAAGVLAPASVLAVLMWRELGRIPRPAARKRAPERVLIREVLREAAPLAGAVVLVSIYTRIGVVFVNEAQSGAGVAEFTFAFLFIEQAIVVAAILAATLLPMLAERGVGASRDRAPVVGDMLSLVTFVGSVGALALIALARPIVLLIGGDELEGAVELLTLLAPTCAALFANFYMGYVYVAARRAGRYLLFNLVGLAISVGLGFALTLDQGADAAARVTWITETVVVLLAAAAFFWRSARDRLALLHLVALLAVVVACAELVAAGTVAPAVAALIGAALTLVLSLPRARPWLGYARAVVSNPAIAPQL
jgi:O-antigen/teichoic acid export membrane protein